MNFISADIDLNCAAFNGGRDLMRVALVLHAGVAEETALICYCRSPARFLDGDSTYLELAALPAGVRTVAAVAGNRE